MARSLRKWGLRRAEDVRDMLLGHQLNRTLDLDAYRVSKGSTLRVLVGRSIEKQ